MAREFTMGARINLDVRGYNRSMADAIRQTSNLGGEIIDLDQAAGRYRDSSGRLREANGRFVSSLGQVNAGLERQQHEMSKTSRAGNALKGVFVALGGAMAARGLYDWLIESNASMEQYKNTLTTILKSEEKAVDTLAWANKFAAQTPFEIPEIVEATTVMAAYGMTAQDNLGIIGDMASVMGKDLMQAVEAIADANTGELERLKEFGITKKMIEEQAALMGKQVFDKKGSMKDQEAFNEVLFSMMNDRFKGGMEMQAQTFKGMISNAQDFIATIGRTLGKPLFDKMKVGMEGMLDTLNGLQENGTIDRWIVNVQKSFGKLADVVQFIRYDIVGAITEVFGSFIEKNVGNFALIGAVISLAFSKVKEVAIPVFDYLVYTAFPALLRGMRDAGTYVLDLASSFIMNFEKFKPYIIGIATALGTYKLALIAINVWNKIVAKSQLIWNAVMAANPVMLIVIGIGLLIGYLIHLAGGWDVVREKLKVFFSQMQTLWTTMLPKIKATLSTILTAVIGWAVSVWTTVKPYLMILWNGIVDIFNSIKSFWNTWGGVILATLSIAWAGISSMFTSYLSIIWTVVKGGFQLIWSIISNTFQMVVGVLTAGWAIISGLFSIGLNLLSGNWSGAWDAMLGMLDGVWTGIKTFFSGLKDLFFESGKAIITTLVDGITAMASAPVKAIKGVLDKVREYLPFSDAKKGPLSNLTLNGGKIVTTMAEGIRGQQGALTSAMGDVLEPNATGTANVSAGSANPAGRVAQSTAGGRAAVIIKSLVEKIEIYGAGDKNASTLVDEILAELYERFVNADEILSAAGLGDLLRD